MWAGVHVLVVDLVYAPAMEKDAWIMAAWLLENHGVDALTVVERRLAELERDYESGRLCAVEAVELGLWRQTGRAVLEIVKDRSSSGGWMH